MDRTGAKTDEWGTGVGPRTARGSFPTVSIFHELGNKVKSRVKAGVELEV